MIVLVNGLVLILANLAVESIQRSLCANRIGFLDDNDEHIAFSRWESMRRSWRLAG